MMNEKDWELQQTGKSLGSALDLIRSNAQKNITPEDIPTAGGGKMVRLHLLLYQ
jgi:hypothetical protein